MTVESPLIGLIVCGQLEEEWRASSYVAFRTDEVKLPVTVG